MSKNWILVLQQCGGDVPYYPHMSEWVLAAGLAAYSNFFHKSGKTENFWVAAICSFSNSLMIRHSINCPLLYSLERWISQKLKIQSSSNGRGDLQQQIPSSSAFFIRFTDFSHFFTASDSNSSNFDSYSIRTTPICKKAIKTKLLKFFLDSCWFFRLQTQESGWKFKKIFEPW